MNTIKTGSKVFRTQAPDDTFEVLSGPDEMGMVKCKSEILDQEVDVHIEELELEGQYDSAPPAHITDRDVDTLREYLVLKKPEEEDSVD